MKFTIKINALTEDYCKVISQAFTAQGWHKPETQYQKYLQETQAGSRTILLAEDSGEYVGYVMIVWEPDYPPFREAAIPEIQDFNVLKKYQRQGAGTALLDEAERLIGERSARAGIGVGLYSDYGPAQIMYVKRGYIPDGRGIFQGGHQLAGGEQAIVDDDLVLYFTKELETN